jgi:hypothetical protein
MLEMLRRYTDVSWSMYVERLKDWAELKGQGEDKVFNKLRNKQHQKSITLYFLHTVKANRNDCRLREWERLSCKTSERRERNLFAKNTR